MLGRCRYRSRPLTPLLTLLQQSLLHLRRAGQWRHCLRRQFRPPLHRRPCVETWWRTEGRARHAGIRLATSPTAAANGCRPRTWQHALQRVQCNRHGVRVAIPAAASVGTQSNTVCSASSVATDRTGRWTVSRPSRTPSAPNASTPVASAPMTRGWPNWNGTPTQLGRAGTTRSGRTRRRVHCRHPSPESPGHPCRTGTHHQITIDRGPYGPELSRIDLN